MEQDETHRHDREAGRQLAGAVLAFAALAVVASIWGDVDDPGIWVVDAILLAVAVAALAFPVAAIRLVSGRWAELFPKRPGELPHIESVRQLRRQQEEGVPLEVAVVEAAVPDPAKRSRLGEALMSVAMTLFVASYLARYLGGLGLEDVLCPFAMLLFPIGLVIYYRTL